VTASLTLSAVTAELDLQLSSGRVHGRRVGREEDPLVLCVHGLTANLSAFSWLAEGLVRAGFQVVAIDCRGRGRSEVTAPGTYGLAAHAHDVVEVAAQLGHERIRYLGWSMGGLVGTFVAREAPELLQRLVMLDIAGPIDPAGMALVEASLLRLDAVVDSPAEYVDAVRAFGVVDPWTPFWTQHYEYELEQRPDGSWSPSTDRAACAEDLADAAQDWPAVWSALTMPTTLVRGGAPIRGALLVTEETRDAMAAAVPALEVVEVPTNHYTVMTDPQALAAVLRAFA